MRLILFKVILFKSILILASCNNSAGDISKDCFMSHSDSFKRSTTSHLEDNMRLVKLKERYDSILGLEKLTNGTEGLEIRIMVDEYYKQSVVIIRKDQNDIFGKYFSTTMEYAQNSDSIVIGEALNIIPKSGWNSFYAKLNALKICELPDGITLHGDDFEVSRWGVLIEIATKNGYKSILYDEPNRYEHKFWQFGSIMDLLKLLESQFNVKVIPSLD